ncbi:hypothetical protein UFOVP236_70 [uncultured Caudovirales phage]|uniref:Uncharacterized protein n=1 Tax=uncultured Caudovirales phage TaxID=2100421 RepID=A0A6J7WUV8_9CAUD|nr:hypothetical protein UFOVP236_70 [uncultured Caudovirales phage]
MFSSPEAALRFAFRMRNKPIISTPSGVFMSKDKSKNPNAAKLTVYDFHAQAGMIFGKVDRMPIDQQLWVYLTYGDKHERRVCARMLSDKLANNPDAIKMGLSKVGIRNVLLSTSVRQCAKEVGLTNYKAWKIRGSLNADLERYMFKTLDELWEWMGSPE